MGSVRCNLSLDFDSGSKNQTRFWSKLVPFFYVSQRRVNQLECLWVQFGAISVPGFSSVQSQSLGLVRCNLSLSIWIFSLF
jgi:hypothetical protein